MDVLLKPKTCIAWIPIGEEVLQPKMCIAWIPKGEEVLQPKYAPRFFPRRSIRKRYASIQGDSLRKPPKQEQTAKGRFAAPAALPQIQGARSLLLLSTGRVPDSCGAWQKAISFLPPREDALAAFMSASAVTPIARCLRIIVFLAGRQGAKSSSGRRFVATPSARRAWGIAWRRKRSADLAGAISPKRHCVVLSWHGCAFASTPCSAFRMCSNTSNSLVADEASVPYRISQITSAPMEFARFLSHSAR